MEVNEIGDLDRVGIVTEIEFVYVGCDRRESM